MIMIPKLFDWGRAFGYYLCTEHLELSAGKQFLISAWKNNF
jgi:hypothetical protein